MKINAIVKNLRSFTSKDIILQDILKSYTSSIGSPVQNYYEIDNKLWAIYITLFRSENVFEQILIPKDSLFRTSNDTYFAYHLSAKIQNAQLRTFRIYSVYDNSLIEDEYKLFITPLSNWDYLVIGEIAYQFEYLVQSENGELQIFVGSPCNANTFFDSYGV